GDKINLQWTVDSDDPNTQFDVERSADGNRFEHIGHINGNHNTGINETYSFADGSAQEGINYYRLKVITGKGHPVYSQIIQVKAPASVSPIQIAIAGTKELKINVKKATSVILCNAAGQVVTSLLLKAGMNNISIAQLSPGLYFLRSVEYNLTKRFYAE